LPEARASNVRVQRSRLRRSHYLAARTTIAVAPEHRPHHHRRCGIRRYRELRAPDIKTPNIDSLAKAGTRFTQFYANGSSCTPTRAGLISGRYQQRFALERPLGHATSADANLGLPANGQSLPQLLRGRGYATALIGKWHLGYQPQFSPKATVSTRFLVSRPA
jgi:arylsulfatase A-like enzyme